MNNKNYDVIVVGSGTCGATIARELSAQNKSVLLLERGQTKPLKESFMGFVSVADEVKLGDKFTTVRALTTGGSTGLYFGVVNAPPLDVFKRQGIDLTDELAAVKQELPIAPLPDELLGAQTIKLRDSAQALGHNWHKHDMLIDQAKCVRGYNSDARWRARSFVEQAVSNGAHLVTGATVTKVLSENGVAVGVEYTHKTGMFSSKVLTAHGKKVVMAAGELATPKILRDSGIKNIGANGFYCDPGYALYGLVPGMNAEENFVGSMGMEFEEGIELGDANVSKLLHRLLMLSGFKLRHMFNYGATIGIGVKTHDEMGGTLDEQGRFHKTFTAKDQARLDKGEAEARKILEKAGATHIFNVGLTSAGHVGGLLQFGEHLDSQLQTPIANLHVCDGSVFDEQVRVTPTVTLVCLARYLSKQLAQAV